jgi:hypothetical protein
MVERSPTLDGSEWLDGGTGSEVGARFVGHNHVGPARYSRECEITALEPGRELAFQTFFKGAPSVRWSYQFEPSGDSTKVTESYEMISLPRYVRVMLKIPGMDAKDTGAGMALTLERIAAIAEG